MKITRGEETVSKLVAEPESTLALTRGYCLPDQQNH